MVVSEVAATMRSLGVWWAVAGGWAIDLWLGHETRSHHDVEVVVRRGDQQQVRAALAGEWDLFCLDPPGTGWRPWAGHMIERPAFQLQARNSSGEFDVFLEDIDDGIWRYRRDPDRHRSVDSIVVLTASNIPIIRPEVQLLYMATSTDPKNAHDFDVALPTLDSRARAWLRAALESSHAGHPWIAELDSMP